VFIAHLVNLLIRSAAIAPARIGSNWGGVVFALLVFLATEAALYFGGEMTGRYTRAVLIGLAAVVASWCGLFCLSVVLTLYDDHQNIAGAAVRIKHDSARANLSGQLQNAKRDAEERISDLRTQCAVKDGINQTLEKQNRDQQSSINGCLTQAIGLLKPSPLNVIPIVLDHIDDPASQSKIGATRVILLVNHNADPATVHMKCREPVVDVTAKMLGGGPNFPVEVTPVFRYPTNEVQMTVRSWSSSSLMLIKSNSSGSDDANCGFGIN
jgi:hypothetical protein